MTGTSAPVSTVPGAPTPVTPSAKTMATPAVRSIMKTRASTAVLRAQEGKTTFTLEMRIDAEQSASLFNMASTHFEFVKKMSQMIKGEVYFVPTNEMTDPKPAPFSKLEDFPQTEAEHRAFFHRKETTLRSTKQVSIKITHCVITEDNVASVKKKLMPWLQANRIWMSGETLKNEEISVIAWASAAHADMIHKPTLTQKMNAALAKLQLTPEQKQQAQQLGLADGALPEVFATKRLIQFGNGAQRVSSEVVAVCCVHKHSEFAKNLLVEVPSEDIGFELIPIGFHLLASSEEYREFLMRNNDVTLNLRGITVVNVHPSVWEMPWPTDRNMDSNFNGTIHQYFTNLDIIDSIQPTDNTIKNGRWIVIVEDEHFDQAHALLTTFFQDKFPQLVDRSYLDYYGAYPRLTFAAPGFGHSMQNKVHSLRQILRQAAQPSNNVGLPPITENAWNRRPRMVFDLTGVQTPSPAMSRPKLASEQPPQGRTDSSVTRSTTDNGSESVAGESVGQSAPKTVHSQDLTTVVSYLDTVLSRQEEQNKRMMDFMAHAQQAQAQQAQAQIQQTQMLTQLFTPIMGVQTSTLTTVAGASPPPAKRPATEMAVDHHQGSSTQGDAPMGDAPTQLYDTEGSSLAGFTPFTQMTHQDE